MTNKVEEMRELYEMYREFHFGEAIPPVEEVTIDISERLTSSGGYCMKCDKLIVLSAPYLRRYPQDDLCTLLHEMIHLVEANHGPRFYRWMDKINRAEGQELVRRNTYGRATKGEWLYMCIECGMEYDKAKRLRDGGARHRCRCKGLLTEVNIGA